MHYNHAVPSQTCQCISDLFHGSVAQATPEELQAIGLSERGSGAPESLVDNFVFKFSVKGFLGV